MSASERVRTERATALHEFGPFKLNKIVFFQMVQDSKWILKHCNLRGKPEPYRVFIEESSGHIVACTRVRREFSGLVLIIHVSGHLIKHITKGESHSSSKN